MTHLLVRIWKNTRDCLPGILTHETTYNFWSKWVLERLGWRAPVSSSFLLPCSANCSTAPDSFLPPPSLGSSLLHSPFQEVFDSSFPSFSSAPPVTESKATTIRSLLATILQSRNQRPRPSRSLLATMLMPMPTNRQASKEVYWLYTLSFSFLPASYVKKKKIRARPTQDSCTGV